MCDLHSCGSAGSGYHSDKFTTYHNQNPLHVSGLDFAGPGITDLGPGITVEAGDSDSHATMDVPSSTPTIPFATNTDGHQTTNTRELTVAKLVNGKRLIPLSTKNVYSSIATGGRGKARVGGGGVPAGACIVM